MKAKKNKLHRPWLTPGGVEIPTARLCEISRSWSPSTWENYLKWYETSCREALISSEIYAEICDEQTENIFEQFLVEPSPEVRFQCEQLLVLLPALEAEVLRLAFFEGRTEVEIAFILNRSQTGICLIKNRALLRLRRGNRGDNMLARHLMRGERAVTSAERPSIWDEQGSTSIHEHRSCDPSKQKTEFDAVIWTSFREALEELSETAKQILYQRYWCNLSLAQVARQLRIGVNAVQDIESVSISKIKRKTLSLELGENPGGGPCS